MKFIFPLSFILTLLLSSIFVRVFRGYLSSLGIRRLFPVFYLAIHLHEICHYLMALVFLKWPKYEGVEVTSTKEGFKIHGGVMIKVYKYKDLIHNIFNGSFVLETLYLIQKVVSGFFIGLAPVIIPYLILFYFFSKQGINFEIFDLKESLMILSWWRVLLLFPFIFFGAIIASPSWSDVKQTFPLFFILFLIPIPFGITDFLFFFSFLLFIGISLFLLLWFLLFIRKVAKR